MSKSTGAETSHPCLSKGARVHHIPQQEYMPNRAMTSINQEPSSAEWFQSAGLSTEDHLCGPTDLRNPLIHHRADLARKFYGLTNWLSAPEHPSNWTLWLSAPESSGREAKIIRQLDTPAIRTWVPRQLDTPVDQSITSPDHIIIRTSLPKQLDTLVVRTRLSSCEAEIIRH